MSGLSNLYVHSLAKKCIQNFRSVVSSDVFSKQKLEVGDKYIVNLAKSDEKNGHFVAIIVEKNCFLYFDSYALPCYNSFVLSAFARKPTYEIKYSKKSIQGVFSYFCGYFCICWLICNDLNLTWRQFEDLFSQEKHYHNEDVCLNIIKSYIKSTKH